MVYGVWCLVYGLWFMAYGIRYMVYGIWCMVDGFRVSQIKVQGLGFRHARPSTAIHKLYIVNLRP